jgi:hypothetical protein
LSQLCRCLLSRPALVERLELHLPAQSHSSVYQRPYHHIHRHGVSRAIFNTIITPNASTKHNQNNQ